MADLIAYIKYLIKGDKMKNSIKVVSVGLITAYDIIFFDSVFSEEIF